MQVIMLIMYPSSNDKIGIQKQTYMVHLNLFLAYYDLGTPDDDIDLVQH